MSAEAWVLPPLHSFTRTLTSARPSDVCLLVPDRWLLALHLLTIITVLQMSWLFRFIVNGRIQRLKVHTSKQFIMFNPSRTRTYTFPLSHIHIRVISASDEDAATLNMMCNPKPPLDKISTALSADDISALTGP